MRRLLLTHWMAPGDLVCMTACVRDLHLAYPGEFEVHVATACPEIWQHNPQVAGNFGFGGGSPPGRVRRIFFNPARVLRHARDKNHYLTAFHQELGRQLRRPIPVRVPRGDLHLASREREERPAAEPYWLVIAGGKRDLLAKVWSTARFQQVVDALRARGVACVQAGAALPGHWHPALRGVKSFVGPAHPRQFLQLIFHAEGVICPVTFAMHAAAAFEKPCVVLAGGREPWEWEAYVNAPQSTFGPACAPVRVEHRFLHAIGQLPCCAATGCWKAHLPAGAPTGPHDCLAVVDDGAGQRIPACLAAVTGEQVVAAVMSYE